MPQPATKASPKWTDNHELALSGLTNTLKIPKKEARSFLEDVPSGDVAEMMRQALAARTRSQAPPPLIPGAPSGAVPIHPQAQSAPEAPPTSPAQPAAAQLPVAPIPKKRDMFNRIADALTGWAQPSWVGGGPLPPKAPIAATSAAAPITPAAAQTQPAPEATPPVKPRVRVRAVGQRIPPAPIGPGGGATEEEPEAPAEAKGKQATPLPIVRSVEEYNQLPAGTEFIWHLDNHVYEKPVEKTAEA